MYSSLESILPYLDEPLDQIIQKLGEQPNWIRFYIQKKDSSMVFYSVNGNSKKTTTISTKGFNMYGSRGFGNLPEYISQKQRVLTFMQIEIQN